MSLSLLRGATLALENCVARDVTQLSLEQQETLTGAFTAAVQEFYSKAPAHFKRTPGTDLVGDTRALTGLAIAAGSCSNTGTPFLPEDRGQTVRLGGMWNEITSTISVLRPNPSPVTWTEGTLYKDTLVFFGTSVEKQTGTVWCVDGEKRWKLVRQDNPSDVLPEGASPFLDALYSGNVYGRERSIGGVPAYYSYLPVGESIATGPEDAAFMIRVHPIPTRSFIIETLLDILPPVYTVASLHNGSVLPIAEERFGLLLRPLIDWQLIRTKLWRSDSPASQFVMPAYQSALEGIRNLPSNFVRPSRTVGRRVGW
jgi:hypothetical protein